MPLKCAPMPKSIIFVWTVRRSGRRNANQKRRSAKVSTANSEKQIVTGMSHPSVADDNETKEVKDETNKDNPESRKVLAILATCVACNLTVAQRHSEPSPALYKAAVLALLAGWNEDDYDAFVHGLQVFASEPNVLSPLHSIFLLILFSRNNALQSGPYDRFKNDCSLSRRNSCLKKRSTNLTPCAFLLSIFGLITLLPVFVVPAVTKQ